MNQSSQITGYLMTAPALVLYSSFPPHVVCNIWDDSPQLPLGFIVSLSLQAQHILLVHNIQNPEHIQSRRLEA